MKFTLDANGAQAAGQGIGNMFKAYALGNQYRQQGEMDGMTSVARIGQANAAARKYNADAALDEHRLGLQKDPLRTALIENQVPLDTRPVIESFPDWQLWLELRHASRRCGPGPSATG